MAVEKEKKTCCQIMAEWKEFIWNPRTHQFMGRTGSSWAMILLFYLLFYGFLTALFTLTMWVMLQTVDPFNPKYQDRLSVPGMMIRPKTDALDITYNVTNTETWESYVKLLNNFLDAYNNSKQAASNQHCLPGKYHEEPDSPGVVNQPKTACQFNRTMLGDCSGLNDTTYGYREGHPCILVKMNRVMNFYAGDHRPMNVSCTAKKEEDTQKLGEMAMFPANGNIDLMYFPYYGKKIHVNYTQPVVAVKFLNLTFNYDHNVECRINAANIATTDERDKFAGRVAFKIRVNKD
ncbi:sodium/potassium-transporting ATPase subunit beta-2 [Rhineura floridana]|uniref:sodium/potassium-transporting ATPase subunit beta-2 n=1 Tax=Rhineura floridana TaxID=261503 RepID=UPI002AC7FA93|nr:sodium/potassium-transporting ATPase subunit beta-2 [Rhineura floridana]